MASAGGMAKNSRGRAEREGAAQTMRLDTVAGMSSALALAARGAYVRGEFATVVSAVRAAADLLEAGVTEERIARTRELDEEFAELTGGRRSGK